MIGRVVVGSKSVKLGFAVLEVQFETLVDLDELFVRPL